MPEPVIVQVGDTSGKPVSGVTVDFSMMSYQEDNISQVSTTNIPNDVVFDPPQVVTGTDGTASMKITMGSRPGVYKLKAKCPNNDCDPNQEAEFQETAECSLSHASFSWKQSSGTWANDSYDDSYYLKNDDFNLITNGALILRNVSSPGETDINIGNIQGLTNGRKAKLLVDKLNNTQSNSNIQASCDINVNECIVGGYGRLVKIYHTYCEQHECDNLPLELGRNGIPGDNILRSMTIAKVGCNLTSFAMTISYVGGTDILTDNGSVPLNPSTLNSFAANRQIDFNNTAHKVSNPNVRINNYASQGAFWHPQVLQSIGTNRVNNQNKYQIQSGIGYEGLAKLSIGQDAEKVKKYMEKNLCENKLPVVVGTKITGGTVGHFLPITGIKVPDQGARYYEMSNPAYPTWVNPQKYIKAERINVPGNEASFDQYFGANDQPYFKVVGAVKDPTDGEPDINIYSTGNVELTLLDEFGQHAGKINEQTSENEIPDSIYVSSEITEPEGLEIVGELNRYLGVLGIKSSNYKLVLSGVTQGPYSVSINVKSAFDNNPAPVRIEGIAETGSIRTIVLSVTPDGTQIDTKNLLGDRNGDGAVDCLDIGIIRTSFGKRQGQTGFDPRADANVDGIVDVRDLAIVSRQLTAGTKCP